MTTALHQVDFYKTGHGPQYPDNSEYVYSGWTPRSVNYAQTEKITVFGPQAMVGKFLIKEFNDTFFNQPLAKVIKKYKRRMDNSLGKDVVGTAHIAALHKLGYLPLHIKSLPEGVQVNPKIPTLTMVNTLPEFFWLTNYLESAMSGYLWLPSTSASIAREYFRILTAAAIRTGTPVEFVPLQGHDFSMRGMYPEPAAGSGSGHLAAGFVGTDTVTAIDEVEDYYGADSDTELVGVSVPATEHSVMCMGGMDDEIGTFRRLLKMYPAGIVSIVSDTWDFWKVMTEFAPLLKKEIRARKHITDDQGNIIVPGKTVFRPDSGCPVKILTGYTTVKVEGARSVSDMPIASIEHLLSEGYEAIELADAKAPYKFYKFSKEGVYASITEAEAKGAVEVLWDEFGGSVNLVEGEIGSFKRYKQLEEVGLIYGDSITLERAQQIVDRLADKGFASGNVVLGIGSFTYQYNTRDTYGYAMKATWGQVAGEGREIFKDPKTDDGLKKSAKGLMRVELEDGEYVLYDQQTKEQEAGGELQTIFLDGVAHNFQTLADIRARTAIN
jgi:nicotinamide phosphoribosyltransferase